MTTTLITGANQGLGRETARRLLDAGHDVWMGARDETAGRAAADELGGRYLAMDVTSSESVAAAAQVEAAGGLDVLVNNAGITAGMLATLDTSMDAMTAVLDTNVCGPVRATLAFLPLLRRSAAPVVVNVSSGLGSFALTTDPAEPEHDYPGMDYPASKAALNMLTIKLAQALPGMRINAVAPGLTSTNLNAYAGTRTVREGAEVIVAAAQLGPDGPTGTFFDATGPVGW